MKNKLFKMVSKAALVLAAVAITFSSCKKDDKTANPPGVVVEDGIYVTGAGTALPDFDIKGLMKVAKNEVLQEDRATLLELYIAVKAGSEGFHIVSVEGSTQTSYGPGTDWAMVDAANLDVEEPTEGLWKGTLETNENMFTVPEDGLYHIIIDTEINKVAMARVKWGAIGSATPDGWGGSTAMNQKAFDLNKIEFMIDEITLTESDWKFRYSNGWKIILDADLDLGGGKKGVKVNCNLGGTLDALTAGGDNFVNSKYGIYSINLTWELGMVHTSAVTFVKDGEPLPEYPAALYMIGDAVGDPDWSWDKTDLPMNPVHSHPNAFWKILWIKEAGSFKMAPGKEWKDDFGVAVDPVAGMGDFLKGTTNIPAPGTAGYYMVWVDLDRDSISIAPAEVYLIGPTANDKWDAAMPEYKFTVDNANKKITLTKDMTAGDVRMHVWHKWHYDWWQHEFNIIDGKIEYRGTGDDQTGIPNVAAGSHTIDLMFDTETGSVN